MEGERFSHTSTRSHVSHSNLSWPLLTLERWRQPRERKWPAAGPGRLSLSTVPQGTPGHLPDRAPQPYPCPLCSGAVPTQRGASSRVPAHAQVPRELHPSGPLTWRYPRSAATRTIPGPASHGLVGTQGSLVQQLGPGQSGSAGLAQPRSLLLLWRRPRHVTPQGRPPQRAALSQGGSRPARASQKSNALLDQGETEAAPVPPVWPRSLSQMNRNFPRISEFMGRLLHTDTLHALTIFSHWS